MCVFCFLSVLFCLGKGIRGYSIVSRKAILPAKHRLGASHKDQIQSLPLPKLVDSNGINRQNQMLAPFAQFLTKIPLGNHQRHLRLLG